MTTNYACPDHEKDMGACKRHEVMVKLVKYSLCILDFPWIFLESRTLESRIRNPGGWNPESKGLESGIQRPGSGIQDLHGFSFMGLRWLQIPLCVTKVSQVLMDYASKCRKFIVLFKFGGNMNLWVCFILFYFILLALPWQLHNW